MIPCLHPACKPLKRQFCFAEGTAGNKRDGGMGRLYFFCKSTWAIPSEILHNEVKDVEIVYILWYYNYNRKKILEIFAIRRTKMKKKVATCIAVVLALSAIFCVNVFALRGVFSLPANQYWVGSEHQTRTGKYSYALARCYAVYPTGGGWDFFEKVQTELRTTYGRKISDTYILDETKNENKQIKIYEGEQNEKAVMFVFRGNSKEAAKADIYYHAN